MRHQARDRAGDVVEVVVRHQQDGEPHRRRFVEAAGERLGADESGIRVVARQDRSQRRPAPGILDLPAEGVDAVAQRIGPFEVARRARRRALLDQAANRVGCSVAHSASPSTVRVSAGHCAPTPDGPSVGIALQLVGAARGGV